MEEEYNKSKSTQWIVGGFILLIVSVIFCAGTWHLGMALLGEITEEVQIDIEIPNDIGQDQTLGITVVVRNVGEEEIILKSIHIEEDFQKSFELELIDPPYLNVYERDAFGNDPVFQIYDFAIPISPGNELRVMLTGKSGVPKDLGGQIKVCVNSNYICKSDYIFVDVKADIE